MDRTKLDDIFKRIARLRAPTPQALELSRAALEPLADHLAKLATDPRAQGGDIALERSLIALRIHVAEAEVAPTREFFENVLSNVARLKS
jgi:hypothetical protein